jgi:hypothetical protein
MDPTHFELISAILLRPQMFSTAKSLRELLVFVRGVCAGIRPPHGSGVLGGFPDFVNTRFCAPAGSDWCAVLEAKYANEAYLDACSTIHAIFHEWHSTLP